MKSIRIVNLHQNFLKLSRPSLCSPPILHHWKMKTTEISWEMGLKKSLHPWGQKTKESFFYWVSLGDQSTFSGFHSNASLDWIFLLTPTQNQIPVLGLDENTHTHTKSSKPLALYAVKILEGLVFLVQLETCLLDRSLFLLLLLLSRMLFFSLS